MKMDAANIIIHIPNPASFAIITHSHFHRLSQVFTPV